MSDRVHRQQIGTDRGDWRAGQEADGIKPMAADIGHGAQRPAGLRKDSPVEIGVLEQPVLKVTSADMQNPAEVPAADFGSRIQQHRVKPHVVIDGRDKIRPTPGKSDKLRRFVACHPQGFFANDMLAG